MNVKLKYVLLVLGAGCFIYLILNFGLKEIAGNLIKTGWFFIPIVLIWSLVYLFNAIAWQFIINKRRLPFIQLFFITISGYALNYLTPFFNLGGEPYRVVALKERLGINKSISVTLSYLMLHFLSSFLIWITAVILILFYMPVSKTGVYILIITLILFIFITGLFFRGYKYGVVKSFSGLIVKLPLLKKFSGEIRNKEKTFLEIDDYTTEFYQKRKRDFYAAVFFEYLSRLIATMEFYFILKSLGLSSTFMDAFIINAGNGLVNNFFFIVPFELGIKEGALYSILGLLNYSPQLGIYVSLVLRLRELAWIIVGLILIPLTKSKIYAAAEVNENFTIE